MSTRTRPHHPVSLPAASPLPPRVEARRGPIPEQRQPAVSGRLCGQPAGPRPARMRLQPDPWRPLVALGVFLIILSTAALFFEFALKPLLSLAIDFATWAGFAAPH